MCQSRVLDHTRLRSCGVVEVGVGDRMKGKEVVKIVVLQVNKKKETVDRGV